MIPDETVERVREAADIVEIIGEHVRLRRQGSTWRGPCPFHHGSNPNFSVSPQKGFYHCFKCGVSGDVFTFLQEHTGLSFTDAVKEVGARSGIEVRDVSVRRQERDPRSPLWEALAAAESWFSQRLWEDAGGREARDYLAQRKLPRDLAERFSLGFAPRDADALRSHLHALGMDDERLLQAGLFVHREGEATSRPRFRGRLMFPIGDASGRPSGFGGRVLGDGEPKYLNSPESDVFSKGRLLYGLHLAKQAIRKEERALVVEGYMDVMRLAGAGVEPVVAPLGTALTPEQSELLARLTNNVFLLYDSDDAGLKATFRAGLELLRLGVAPRVVTLPDGEDPDSFVQRHGAEGLERQLAASVDVFERQLQILDRRGWFADLHRARRAIDKLLPTIRAASDALTRELYIGSLAERAGVDRELLVREAAEEPRGRPGAARRRSGSDTGAPEGHGQQPDDRNPRQQEPEVSWGSQSGFRDGNRGGWEKRRRDKRRDLEWLSDRSRPRVVSAPGVRAERYLTLAMLHLPAYRARITHDISVEDFRSPVFAELFAVLSTVDGHVDAEVIAEELSDEAAAELELLLEASPELEAPNRLVDDSLVQLRLRALREHSAEVQRMLLEESQQGGKDVLLAEKIRIRDEIRALRGDVPTNVPTRAAQPREEEVT